MFSHEKLVVYQKSVVFVAWTQPLIESLPAKASVRDQLDRASTSIALNIAEGNVKFSQADRARFLQVAVGSAVESAACLDVSVARKLCTAELIADGKEQLQTIVSMLMGLLDRLGYRFDTEGWMRVREDAPPSSSFSSSSSEEGN
jgi:four helix bundle protein